MYIRYEHGNSELLFTSIPSLDGLGIAIPKYEPYNFVKLTPDKYNEENFNYIAVPVIPVLVPLVL